jgi:hypothetical protein
MVCVSGEEMLAIYRKISLPLRVLPFMVVVISAKILLHMSGWEYLDLNALFTSLLAAAIFIFGFLISGILADYKESEKLPGDMACDIEAIFDEAYIIYRGKKGREAAGLLRCAVDLSSSLVAWFKREERSRALYDAVAGLNDHFLAVETLTDPGFINRLKQEQTLLRKSITRAHTIRETSFVSSAYAIAVALAFFLIVGLLFVKIEPFYESMFFNVLITFLLVYLLLLIRELDNPFEYSEDCWSVDHVSLKPLCDAEERLKMRLNEVLGSEAPK